MFSYSMQGRLLTRDQTLSSLNWEWVLATDYQGTSTILNIISYRPFSASHLHSSLTEWSFPLSWFCRTQYCFYHSIYQVILQVVCVCHSPKWIVSCLKAGIAFLFGTPILHVQEINRKTCTWLTICFEAKEPSKVEFGEQGASFQTLSCFAIELGFLFNYYTSMI